MRVLLVNCFICVSVRSVGLNFRRDERVSWCSCMSVSLSCVCLGGGGIGAVVVVEKVVVV